MSDDRFDKIPLRIRTALSGNGITTVEQIEALEFWQWMRVRGLGRKSLAEVEALGIRLKVAETKQSDKPNWKMGDPPDDGRDYETRSFGDGWSWYRLKAE